MHLRLSLLAAAVTALSVGLSGGYAGHDYIEFHAAAQLLGARESPYAPEPQRRAQAPLRPGTNLGPNEAVGFLPYYYPPWPALMCWPLTLFPYQAAKVIWVYIGFLGLVYAGDMLHRPAGPLSRRSSVFVAVLFLPSIFSVLIGQTAPLVLWLGVLVWHLLQKGRDRAAGVALAWLSVKPTLAIVAIPGMIVWAVRQGRWSLIASSGLMLGAMCAVSTMVLPSWPVEMYHALRRIPLDTVADPRVGATWPLALRVLGFDGWRLALANAATAVVVVATILMTAWRKGSPAADTLGLGLLTAFFVSPYAKFYDYPVLLVPLTIVLGRLPRLAAAGLLLALMLVPYLHLPLIGLLGFRLIELIWMPAILALAWLTTSGRTKRPV